MNRRTAICAVIALFLAAGGLAVSPPASAPVHAAVITGSGGFDGNPATTERLAEGHPTFAAIDISKSRFDETASGGRRARHAVLSRQDTFADSVAGSALTGEGPLLFTASDQL